MYSKKTKEDALRGAYGINSGVIVEVVFSTSS